MLSIAEGATAELWATACRPFATSGEHKVLLVEDDIVVRRLICDVLRDLGHRVIEARDGKAGLKILSSDEQMQLLITDVGLAEMNERQMDDSARQYRPKLKMPPSRTIPSMVSKKWTISRPECR